MTRGVFFYLQSFEELIELASRGNSYNVDASASHLMQGFERQGDDASLYADIDFDLDMLVTNFGRCRNQETRGTCILCMTDYVTNYTLLCCK